MKKNKLSLLIDVNLCYSCFACQVACKQEHDLPPDVNWIQVQKIGPTVVAGELRMHFYPMQCRHCAKPPCKDACPVDAITQRSDGYVLISQEECIGCLKCIEACPFGAIVNDPETGLVSKCTLCIERIDQGLRPACVSHCPTGALQFGDANDTVLQKQQYVAERRFGVPLGGEITV